MTHTKLDLLMRAAPFMLQGAVMTIKISFFVIIIGVVFGTLLGIMSSRQLHMRFVSHGIRLYTVILQGTPLYVQILIVYFALPDLLGISFSPFMAGIVALGLNSVAYVSEIVRAGINSIPIGQWSAAYVLGYSIFDTLRYVILPQMLSNILPALTNELVVLIKETSLLSGIGLLELTRVSRNIIARELDPMTIYLAAAALYLFMTSIVSLLARRLEKELIYD